MFCESKMAAKSGKKPCRAAGFLFPDMKIQPEFLFFQ